MKLSEHARKILENFADINPTIIVKNNEDDHTLLRTLARGNAIYATAKIDDVFPCSFAIGDLNTFLATLSAFGEEAEIIFDEDGKCFTMTNAEGNSKAKIVFGDEETMIKPPATVNLPAPDFTFDLKQDDFAKVLKFANILSLPNFRIYSEGTKLFLQACDKANPNANKYQVEVGTAREDQAISIFINRDNLKMIPGDYSVGVKIGKAAIFKNAVDTDLVYLIALAI